jgi:hypothetical protein
MAYALILVFTLTNGQTQTVDPGRSFATQAECEQAKPMVAGYISLRAGERSFAVKCVKH